MGHSIRLFFGMILFIPQFILALFVGLGDLFPEKTFGTKGASKLAKNTIEFIKEIISDEEDETPVQKTTTAKPKGPKRG